MSLLKNSVILPTTFPIDIQILTADFIPTFLPWSIASWDAGFRRFKFYNMPSNLTLCGPPIIVNDSKIRDKLNKLSPGLIFPVVFEKNSGHKSLEKMTGFDWEDLLKRRTIHINGVEENYSHGKLSISSEIGQLTQLKHLRITDCDICGRIPAKIGMLTNLVEFSYCDNEIPMIIPKQIKYLTNLRRLTIETVVVPVEISELKALEELRIYGDYKLSHVPELILPNLELLSITNTVIRGCIPTWISKLPQLTTLDLQRNEFDSVCKISQQLELLNLNGNRFEELHADFGWWFNVRELDISENMIEELPESFMFLSGMRLCKLGGNPLRVIPRQMIIHERSCYFEGEELTNLSIQDQTFLSLCYDKEDNFL
jgi:Leucine-rich repeat (LRR) protein